MESVSRIPMSGTTDSAQIEAMKAPFLHQNLMLERRDRDPMIYYDLVTILGEGSMGSVSKVKKRDRSSAARQGFLERHGTYILAKFSRCLDCCFDDDDDDDNEYHQSHPRDLLVPLNSHSFKHDSTSSLFSGTDDSVLRQEDLSSMIRFGRQDSFFALKSIHLSMTRNPTLTEELKNEVEILKTLDHPNIVRPVETFEYRHSLYLVMELCSGGDLYARDPYSEDDAARIVQSIINAVGYMHRQGISHRDLKYENVMFASTHPMADVKIIDFGLSKKYRMAGEDIMNDAVGTIYSMSPEVLRGNYTKQADLWSCGVLSFMLLSSTMPFYGKSRDVVIRRIVRGRFEFRSPRWNTVSDDAKRFVASLLRVDAQHRPTAEEAARDQWLLTANKPGGRHRKCTSSNIPETMDSVQASIENFANHSRLKKLALMVIAHRSTNDEIGFIRRMFKKYDDNQGYFTLQGFKKALCDYLYTDDEIERIFRGMDIDGSGTVHYFEFLAASMEAHGFINEQQLADAFDRLDVDGSGTISVNDLRKFLGSEVSDASIDSIIDEEDMDADRQVDYKEFLQMWDIESDSLRQRTLQTVARRRIKQNPPRPSKGRSLSFGVIKEDVRRNAVESDTIANGDEFEDEDGDVTFGVQKAISIRRASPISPVSTFRAKIDCADI